MKQELELQSSGDMQAASLRKKEVKTYIKQEIIEDGRPLMIATIGQKKQTMSTKPKKKTNLLEGKFHMVTSMPSRNKPSVSNGSSSSTPIMFINSPPYNLLLVNNAPQPTTSGLINNDMPKSKSIAVTKSQNNKSNSDTHGSSAAKTEVPILQRLPVKTIEDTIQANTTFTNYEDCEDSTSEIIVSSGPIPDSTVRSKKPSLSEPKVVVANEYSVDENEGPPEEHDHDSRDTFGSSSQEILVNGSEMECGIPNLLDETGPYGFRVYLDDKKDTLKTPTWLMSNITKKLYTNMNKPIPFRVLLKKGLPSQKKRFLLRAMAVFKYPMFLRHNVVRCPHHLSPGDPSNVDFINLDHVIRADHPKAYYESSSSGRLSVVAPLDFPEGRPEAIPVLLKFMCHNSCVGGISRRPLAVLLTLECDNEELGRSVIDVRVCACPSRDVRSEEKQMLARSVVTKTISQSFVGRRARKRMKPDDIPNLYDEHDDILFVPVRGVKLYNYLVEIKSLYLKHHPEFADRYPDPSPDTSPYDLAVNSDISPSFSSNTPVSEDESLDEENRNCQSPSEPLSIVTEDQKHYVLQSDLQKALTNGHEIVHSDATETLQEYPGVSERSYSAPLSIISSPSSMSKKGQKNGSFSHFIKEEVVHRNNKDKSILERSQSSSDYVEAVSKSSYRSPNLSQNNEDLNYDLSRGYKETEKELLAAQVLASHLGSQ